MAILSRRRAPFDERLPDGSTAYEALRRLSRGDGSDDSRPLDRAPLDRMAGVASSPVAPESPFRRVAPPPAPAIISPDFEPISRSVAPQTPTLSTIGAPPTMIERNNKGRPVAITGGNDPIKANQELIRAQEGYKAPRSTKDQILSFLQGGVPGGVAYATDQNTRNRWAVGGDIAREEGQIGRELAVQKSQNELLNDQTKRELESAQAIRAARQPATQEPGFTLGEGQVRYDAQGNQIARRPSKAATVVPHNPLFRERKNADGSTTTLQSDDYGKTWTEAPDLGSAAPPEKPDRSPDNSTRAAWYYKKQGEAESAAKDLRDQAAKLDLTTYAGQAAQKDLLARAGVAEKNALEYRDKGDVAATEAPRAARGNRPDTRKGTITRAQQQLWLSHNPGKALSDMQVLYPNAVMVK